MKKTSIFTLPLSNVGWGKKGKINAFYPSYPSLKILLWGKKCKFYPYNTVLEGSKKRGNITPLKGGVILPYPFLNPTPCARVEIR